MFSIITMFKSKVFLMAFFVVSVLVLTTACGGTADKPQEKSSQTEKQETIEQKETASTDKQQNYEIRWATMDTGSSIQVVSTAMLEDIKKNNSDFTGTVLPGSPEANLLGVHQGKFNMGHSLSDVTANAWNGEGSFTEKMQDIRTIATLYPYFSQIITWENSDINSITDLKGKKIITTPKGTSSEYETRRLLELSGLSYNDLNAQFLNLTDGPQQMIDGHADALLYAVLPFPFPGVLRVNSQKQIKLLQIPEDIVNKMSEYQGIIPYSLPANTYEGVNYPVNGFSARAHIVVSEDMPEEVAYNITKTIAENFDRYGDVHAAMKKTTLEELTVDVGIPLHPGALKYYKEQSMIK